MPASDDERASGTGDRGFDLPGYLPGHCQPAQRLRFSLPAIGRLDTVALDLWVAALLGDERLQTAAPAVAPPGVPAPIAALAIRVLRIAAELLRQSRVPSFEMGCVESVTKLSGDSRAGRRDACQVQACVPFTEHYPIPVYSAAYAWAADAVGRMLANPLSPANLASLQDRAHEQIVEPIRKRVPSGDSLIPVLRAAHERGYPFRHLGSGVFRIGLGAQALQVSRGAIDRDSAIGARLAGNKVHTLNLLRAAGFPVPRQRVAASEDAAVAAAREIGFPVVVKPADRERSEGVTVDLFDDGAVRRAYADAAAVSRLIVVENQVPGTCHRLHVVNGKVVYVSRRMPKAVKGDGLRSVGELIEEANQKDRALPPWRRLGGFPDDDLAWQCIRNAGFERDHIPVAGVWVPLRPKQSDEWGGIVDIVTAIAHPANLDLAERAAATLGLANAGVDLITTDIECAWAANDAAINEINFSPQLTWRPETDAVFGAMIDRHFADGARIPIDVVFDDGMLDAESTALAVQQGHLEDGRTCFLVTRACVLDAQGRPLLLACRSVLAAWLAMCLHRDVQALVVVMRPDELPSDELPIDRFDRLIVAAPDAPERPRAHREALARLRASAQATIEPASLM
jgi:cyanophycin synthetase